MALKKETVTSLKRDVAALQDQIAKLTKERDQEKSSKDSWYKSAQEVQSEINAVHDLLDVLPGAIAKKKEDCYSEHKLMTRLASFLANRG